MSENKNIPEIIWMPSCNYQALEKDITNHTLVYSENKHDTEIPYILKSKYDELLKEKEELEDKLENCEILKSACEKANIILTKKVEELEKENHRLKYVKCESCNGTGNCGGIPNVGLACVPCKGKGYLPFE